MGAPATGINGLGMVKLCGLNLEPSPAIGTIIFIYYNSLLNPFTWSLIHIAL